MTILGQVENSEGPKVREGSLKIPILELYMGAAGAAEVVSKTVTRTPPSTRAGGQDYGSYTNSLKLVAVSFAISCY